jgi:hypothetical protein
MKKLTSEKVSGARANKNDGRSYLSLSRQTYKPYLKADDQEERAEKQDQDLDRIIKFAY